MYLEFSGYCAPDGTQHARRGRFLILVQRESDNGTGEIRALVRKVALRQLGHFMMGSAHAFGHRISISGAYGSDGLPVSVPDAVFDRAIPLPSGLREAWNHGGGWNSAGSEAPAMRRWALENLAALEAARRVSRRKGT